MREIDPGETILMTGSAALGACSLIMESRRGEMQRRFPSFFHADSRRASGRSYEDELRAIPVRLEAAGRLAREAGAFSLPCGEGGILAALWELGEEKDCGMEICFSSIFVRQETIELCEALDLDPYTADARGALLICGRTPSPLLAALQAEDIPCRAIGYLTPGPARRLHFRQHIRYLDNPRLVNASVQTTSDQVE